MTLPYERIPIANESAGPPKGFVASASDMVKHRRTEEQLRSALAFQQAILENAGYAIIATDPNGLITIFNPAAVKMLGYGPVEAVGRMNLVALHDPDELAARRTGGSRQGLVRGNPFDHIVRNVYSTSADEQEWTWVRKDGIRLPVLLSLTAIRGADQSVTGFLGIAVDLTERKQIESRLSMAHRLESIGQLAAGVAHEINTPMQYVADNIEFLASCISAASEVIAEYERQLTSDASNWESRRVAVMEVCRKTGYDRLKGLMVQAIADCRDGCERVVSIVRAMRQLSHPGRETFETADLNELIKSASTVARNRWKYVADLELDLDPELPSVECRGAEIDQVFVNLIVNAADAIGELIGESGEVKGVIRIRSVRHDNRVEVHVSDTGCGIPAGNLPRVFDPFFTTKAAGKGTGQGLAIAYDAVVNKHGGTIQVESVVGKGTTFVVSLPISRSPERDEPSDDQTFDSKGELLVEDIIG